MMLTFARACSTTRDGSTFSNTTEENSRSLSKLCQREASFLIAMVRELSLSMPVVMSVFLGLSLSAVLLTVENTDPECFWLTNYVSCCFFVCVLIILMQFFITSFFLIANNCCNCFSACIYLMFSSSWDCISHLNILLPLCVTSASKTFTTERC